MNREPFIFAIAAFGLLSGLFNPIMLVLAKPLADMFASGLLITGLSELSAFFTIVFAATMTIMLGGIPAALFERITGRGETDQASLYIWLACTALLSLPAVIVAVGVVTG
jgi:hypothetical protein